MTSHVGEEPVGERLQAISSLTDISIGHLDVDDLLSELLVRVKALLGADTAAVLLLDRASSQLVARAAVGIEEEVRQGARVGLGRGFAGRVAAERRPVVLHRIDPSTVENPILWQKGIRAMLGVPLQSGTEVLGVLHVGSLIEREFGADDVELLELTASRIAAAMQARELEVERAAARVLQRSLLPSTPSKIPGFQLATRYVPAERGVGGDWYDAFCLPSGQLWVMAGDVVGHGLPAAAIMGRLRSSFRSYAMQSDDPAEVVRRVNSKVRFFEPSQTATVVCVMLPPPYDTMRIISAGHPPPVLTVPGEDAVLLDVPLVPPVGVVAELDAVSAEFKFPHGATLVAYTDGLVERRGEPLDVGFERLRSVVVPKHPEVLCREIMDVMVGRESPRDDLALIVLRRLPDEADS